jgi:hypothetical protein
MRPSDQDVYDLLERVMAFCIVIENEHDRVEAESHRFTEEENAAIKKLVDDAISIRVDASDMSRDIAGHSSM